MAKYYAVVSCLSGVGQFNIVYDPCGMHDESIYATEAYAEDRRKHMCENFPTNTYAIVEFEGPPL